MDDSIPSAPILPSALDSDWEDLPLDARSDVASPDNLTLFDTESPRDPNVASFAAQPGPTTDSEFFSLETMLEGLPEPDAGARHPIEADRPESAPDFRSDRGFSPVGKTVAFRPAGDDVVDLAEMPEEPGRVLEDEIAVAAASQVVAGEFDARSDFDGRRGRRTPSDNIFGELADLDGSSVDDLSERRSLDPAGGRVEGHDWWDFDDATQRNDDRGGFRAAADATEAIDLSGTEQLRMPSTGPSPMLTRLLSTRFSTPPIVATEATAIGPTTGSIRGSTMDQNPSAEARANGRTNPRSPRLNPSTTPQR